MRVASALMSSTITAPVRRKTWIAPTTIARATRSDAATGSCMLRTDAAPRGPLGARSFEPARRGDGLGRPDQGRAREGAADDDDGEEADGQDRDEGADEQGSR